MWEFLRRPKRETYTELVAVLHDMAGVNEAQAADLARERALRQAAERKAARMARKLREKETR